MVLAGNASWIFRFTPYLVFGVAVLAGGIVPKIIPLLKNFMKTFCHKGKMQHLLKKIPVFVVMDENSAMKGL